MENDKHLNIEWQVYEILNEITDLSNDIETLRHEAEFFFLNICKDVSIQEPEPKYKITILN
tara:strand:- start:369 stop:551 length:183 start_codon:yes stop_codon:yes gene_type:complete